MISGPEDVAARCDRSAHLIEGGFVGHFEGTPEAPVWRAIVTSTRKSLGDNADAIYFDTPISGVDAYRVTGNLDGAVYTSFTIEEDGPDGGFPDRTGGVFNDAHFDVDADGNYEVFLGGRGAAAQLDGRSRRPPPASPRGTTGRSCGGRRPCRCATRRSRSRCSTPTGRRRSPTDASVAAGFRRVTNYVRTRTVDMGPPMQGEQPPFVSREPNAFPPPVPPADHSLAAIDASYSMAPYVLGPDEALVITARWPECRFANVNLWNRHMQTFDYVHRSVALNRTADRARARRLVPRRDRAPRPGRPQLARHRGPAVRSRLLAVLPARGPDRAARWPRSSPSTPSPDRRRARPATLDCTHDPNRRAR